MKRIVVISLIALITITAIVLSLLFFGDGDKRYALMFCERKDLDSDNKSSYILQINDGNQITDALSFFLSKDSPIEIRSMVFRSSDDNPAYRDTYNEEADRIQKEWYVRLTLSEPGNVERQTYIDSSGTRKTFDVPTSAFRRVFIADSGVLVVEKDTNYVIASKQAAELLHAYAKLFWDAVPGSDVLFLVQDLNKLDAVPLSK